MSRLDDFRAARLWRLGNRAAQLTLAVTLTLGLSFLASLPVFTLRSDLTADRAHSLSPETLANLRAIARKAAAPGGEAIPAVEILVTLPKDVQGDDEQAAESRRMLQTVHAKMRGLLDAFAHEGAKLGPNRLTVAPADLVRNAKLYTEIAAKMPGAFNAVRTALVVRCGERVKPLDVGELFRIRQVGGKRELDGFRGEEAVLSAILEVTDVRRPVVYYTNNHGELDPTAENPLRAGSRWHAELRSRRFDVRPLNLDRVSEVPADADLVLIGGPLAGFSGREADKLRRYLAERNGRLLALLEPATQHGLDELLLDWGMLALDALVVDTEPATKSPDGDMVIGRLPVRAHATTSVLAETGLPLYAGRLRPVQEDPGRPLEVSETGKASDSTLTVSGLFYTSDSAWGERDYRRPPYAPNFDKGDLAPQLCLACAAERAVRVKGQARIVAGRAIVVGTADIGSDTRYEKGGNRHFLLSATNWLLDRDYLVSVPARPLSEFKLNASADDLTGLARRYALVPLAVALFGFLIHWWRRRT